MPTFEAEIVTVRVERRPILIEAENEAAAIQEAAKPLGFLYNGLGTVQTVVNEALDPLSIRPARARKR